MSGDERWAIIATMADGSAIVEWEGNEVEALDKAKKACARVGRLIWVAKSVLTVEPSVEVKDHRPQVARGPDCDNPVRNGINP